MSSLLIVALTPRGRDLGLRLARALGRGEVVLPAGATRPTLEEGFRSSRPLVCIMALGIVVRILGPLARDKHSEPPVLVVDESGRFVIPVLGGHAAGANALAQEVAAALGAIPILTTASDALGLPAVDLIGQGWGWKVEPGAALTAVAAAVVRGERVGVWQDAGRRDWWQPWGAWPESFVALDTWPPQGDWPGLLVISDRAVSMPERGPVIVYRPPTLVLGVGCRRGVPAEEIEDFFQELCRTERLAPLSLGMVATASLKADEPGLLAFARSHEVPLRAFAVEELAAVGPLPTPSEVVRAHVGVAGVAEPAALLASRSLSPPTPLPPGERGALLVTKRRGRRVTMAVARREA
ncbi:MAG: cobalamin biosynthesis protein [Gemmataceae bacterium]|nr:cobalamin biosynthesis protein [Gemmataceae bacterium]